MSAQLGATFTLPKPVLGYHPGTFLERGASVPFTTPQLNGARARPGPRGDLEFTIPNPSGGRGLYIVPWEGVFALCRPTVHDCRLIASLSGLRGVTPMVIRSAARIIAAEGLAGRAARSAAEAAMAIDEKARMMANFQLLLELVNQTEAASGAAPAGAAQETSIVMEHRARRAVAKIAPDLRRSTEEVAACLEELAGLYTNIGVGRLAAGSRVPRIVADVSALREVMLEWARTHPDDTGADAARIAESAEVTLTCVRVVLAEAHALPRDMRALMRLWLEAPQDLAARITRPDWLVDGWERIGLLWQTAETLGREATLAEMASLIPVLPKEVADWCRIPLPGLSESVPRRRMVSMMEDWRTGVTPYDLIARNEQLLSMAP
ncbi:MAG: hypothetical protein IT555_09715 [Acetobacteraceae bacterium]|nr:hypothetical protein [Acetobacteraceae bacterium]